MTLLIPIIIFSFSFMLQLCTDIRNFLLLFAHSFIPGQFLVFFNSLFFKRLCRFQDYVVSFAKWAAYSVIEDSSNLIWAVYLVVRSLS